MKTYYIFVGDTPNCGQMKIRHTDSLNMSPVEIGKLVCHMHGFDYYLVRSTSYTKLAGPAKIA